MRPGGRAGWGVLALSDSSSDATTSPTVESEIGDNSTIKTTSDVSMMSDAVGSANATNAGISVGLLTYGETDATSVNSPFILSSVGNNTTINSGGDVSINAYQNFWNGSATNVPPGDVIGDVIGASATASSASGGIAAASGSTASSTASPTVDAEVGSGSTLAAAGDLAIDSYSNNAANATDSGVVGGVLASGHSISEITIVNQTETLIGDSGDPATSLTAGGNLSLGANAIDNATAATTCSQGGLLSGGSGQEATISLVDTTDVHLAADTNVIAAGDVTILAQTDPTAITTLTCNSIGLRGDGRRGGIRCDDQHQCRRRVELVDPGK